ncbi:MAG: NAD(P)-binding domain-containing protein [Myxococcota bacterium]|nr:NAD(P)-binding domain-containing protein [Myxococcota bacterium]
MDFSPRNGLRPRPILDRRHQSTVPGVYVAGDLADAPVIKLAMHQGAQLARQIWDQDLRATSTDDPELLDLLIVGAGPAGIGAALELLDTPARIRVLEKDRPFSTLRAFPAGKVLFAEPRTLPTPGGLPFEDGRTEELLAQWDRFLDHRSLPLERSELLGLEPTGEVILAQTAQGPVRCRRVLLATGRRGQPNTLGVPGEQRVRYQLADPAQHSGQRVLVVGGGDSAVEAACDLAEAGADVTLSYRRAQLSRPKPKNKARIQDASERGLLKLELGTTVTSVGAQSVTLARGDQPVEVVSDEVLVQAGARLPTPFLHKLGLRAEGERTWLQWAWMPFFALLVYAFYVLKSGTDYDAELGMHVAKKAFFPFGPGQPLDFVPDLLHVDLGFREVDGAFWGTALYSGLILVFGLRAMWRYRESRVQRWRYLSLISFQLLFLFGIPELLAPAIIHAGGEGGWAWQLFGGDRAWKLYSITVPWPLNIWALIDAPAWMATESAVTAGLWLAVAALVSFVGIPLFVWRHGERFCSWACGCGGLAETLGDLWRHLAPRGADAIKAEWAGRAIFFLAIPTTALLVADAWGLLWHGLGSVKGFAGWWYPLMVDFWLASVVGVALYPLLGNRVWCRFFCPLRAYMELLARRFSRVGIQADDTCISCGECTRYCQMGIDVESYAQQQRPLDNRSSSCIQCGICIEVCPMDVLSIGEAGAPVQIQVGAVAPGPSSCRR